jgi:hypothetical protein
MTNPTPNARLAASLIALVATLAFFVPTATATHATGNRSCSQGTNLLNPVTTAVCGFDLFCAPSMTHNGLCTWRIHGSHTAVGAVGGRIDTGGFGVAICSALPGFGCETSITISLGSSVGTNVNCITNLPVASLPAILPAVSCATTAL